MRFSHLLRGTASVAVLSAIGAGAAYAADAPAPQPNTVSEIVVTAQKRSQSLQDVPVVVTALPARLLQDAGVKDIKDMQILTPGLTVTSTSNETITTARIRGVGTVGDNPGLESSVGVVIDGVYRPRNGVSFGDLGNVDRIEVLKGPQGTLFGKNTSAGVINIITKEPQFTFGAGADLDVGNYGLVHGDGWVTGPIAGDQLAGMLYVADGHRDGYYKVNTAGGPRTDTTDQNQDYWTVRGQLLWQPTDKSSLRIIGDYTKRTEDCCVAVQTLDGPTAGIVNAVAPLGQGVPVPADPYARVAYANRGTTQNIVDDGLSAEFNTDIDGVGKLTSVTAGRHWASTNGQDIDYSGADILYREPQGDTTTFDTFSEELRLAGKTDRLDWLVGGFYANEKLKESQNYYLGNVYSPYLSLLMTNGLSAGFIPCLTGSFNPITHAPGCNGPQPAPGKAVQDEYGQTDSTWALFTNEDFHVTDKFILTFGLRYTEDKKTETASYANVGSNGASCGAALGNAGAGNWTFLGLNGSQQQLAAALLCLPFENPFFNGLVDHQSSNENFVGGTVKATYHWTPDFMTYLSYARGTKAGGFNLDRVVSANGSKSAGFGFTPVLDTGFPAEDVDSYEAGFKATLAGGKVLFDATLFDQTYHHFQLNQFNGLIFVVDSIPEVTSKGVDADFVWFTPVEGMSFQGGVTYADTRYSHFTASQLITPANFASLDLLPGNQLSFAPLWSVSGALTYDHEIADNIRLLANLDAKYLSSYNTGSDLDPNKEQGAYTLVNARVGIGSEDRRWTVEFWAQNLTDVHYKQVAFDAPLQGQAALDPSNAGNRATQTYDAFLGAPRTFGVTLRLRY